MQLFLGSFWCSGVTLASLISYGIWLVWINLLKTIGSERSKSRQFRRIFTFSKCGPLALFGLRWLSLFLTYVCKSSTMYNAASLLVSIVGRERYMCGTSVSTDMEKKQFKCLLCGCRRKFVYHRTLYH